jgi:hypothetical protein
MARRKEGRWRRRMKDEPKRQRCRETDGAQRSPKGDTSVRREGINDEVRGKVYRQVKHRARKQK